MASAKPQKRFQRFLTQAAAVAWRGSRRFRGGPFGAVIVKGNRVLAQACNTVLEQKDATRHAEMNAIRIASKKLKKFSLAGCDIYSTTEPCPMCFSAIHWARIRSVVYSTTIQDVKRLGFNELSISARKMKAVGKSRVKVIQAPDTACRRLLQDWSKLKKKKTY